MLMDLRAKLLTACQYSLKNVLVLNDLFNIVQFHPYTVIPWFLQPWLWRPSPFMIVHDSPLKSMIEISSCMNSLVIWHSPPTLSNRNCAKIWGPSDQSRRQGGCWISHVSPVSISITAISIHNATLLSCHFRKIATVSHCRLVLKHKFPWFCLTYQTCQNSSLIGSFMTHSLIVHCSGAHSGSASLM